MKESRLTITMPVYERKDFFLDALNSALNQTIKCDILVIDNCSSHDFFKQICEEKGVNYIKNNHNIGLFPNWNKCMETASTEYAMILQDDNILELDFVECFQNSLNQYPDIDLYFTDFNVMDLSTKVKSSHHHTYPFGYFENGLKVIEYAAEYGLGLLYSFVIKKEKFTEYYYDFHGSNDWLWIYSNIQNFKVFGDDKKVVNYGTHVLQDSGNSNTHVQCMVTLTYIYDKVISNIENLDSTYKLKAKARSRAAFTYFKAIVTETKLKSILSESNIYSDYLNERIKGGFLFSIYMSLPASLRKTSYKILRKLKLIKRF